MFDIGLITVWEPGTCLGLTWRQAGFEPGQVTQVEVRCEPVGEETRTIVEHFGWDTVPSDHVACYQFPDAVFLRRHAESWQALLPAWRGTRVRTVMDDKCRDGVGRMVFRRRGRLTDHVHE